MDEYSSIGVLSPVVVEHTDTYVALHCVQLLLNSAQLPSW